MSYSEKSLYKEIFKGVYEIDILNANDSELEKISKERALGLSLEEMLKIQKYFKKEEKGRNPTDVELEAFAQSWSEHCCYKSSKTILEKTVFKVKSKDVILAIKEDAAVVNFDDEHAYVVKIESHNHPSALDPYGGAATGVGGILRDILCLDGEEFLFIKNSGEEKIVKIGDYIESLKTHQVQISNKLIEVEPPENLEVLTFDIEKNIPIFKKVKRLFKLHTPEILEITTERGRSLRVTPEHLMLVFNGTKLIKKPAFKLKIGDSLPILSSLPKYNRDNLKIDIISELKKRNFLDVSVKPKSKKFSDFRKVFNNLLKKIGIKAKTRCNYFNHNYMPLEVYLKLEKCSSNLPIKRNDLLLRAFKSRGNIPAVIKIHKDFVRLVGYYLSKGCIKTDRNGNKWVQWSFNRKEGEYISNVCKILDKLELKYNISNSKEFSATSIIVTSKLFGYLFEIILNTGTNCYNVRVPSLFFKLTKELKKELLKGILRGDGDIKISKRKDRLNALRTKVRYSTVSPILFQQVVLLLQSFGYIPYTYEQFTKKSKNNLYVLEISKIEDVKKLSTLFSKRHLRYIENKFGRAENFYKKSNSLTKVNVINIKKIFTQQKVYDITVEDTHIFATTFGILTHNCMGAQPLALINSLFFGNLNFPENKIPEGIKSPRFLFKEVVKGIADYGNRVGIPTLSGMTYFDNSFLGNCLVNVGCVGIVKKDKIAHSRVGDDGDIYILAGGKTGRDGIHGVTFASQNFSCKEEERAAVQLGYAIMKEPLIHACLEINEKGLLTGMKDLGGGGLSCGASEMAFAADKGAIVELEKVLLKEENLKPWEIWVSESQERMLLSVKKKNVEKVLEIFEFWDVPAVVIGTIDSSKRIKVKFHGETVLDLDLEFLIKGVQYKRPYSFKERKKVDVEDPKFKIPNLEKITKKILSSPNIGSKESIIRRYDHEVRGNTILKPMQGIVNKETHGDATVIKPLKDSYKGIAITSDVNPSFCKLDPFLGAASAVEETIRNLVSVNSFPHTLVDCLNFGNPENPESLGAFVRGCEGLYFAANSFKIPFVSGNVSFYNESSLGKIAPTPTLLGIGIVDDVRKIISVDLKKEGNFFYIVGKTKQELGGSEYYKILNFSERGVVPKVFPEETKKIVNSLLKAMNLSLVESCHDCSEGGIFVSAAEMAFGGDLGLNLDLERISSSIRTDFKLFSESNGRFLVEVKRKNAKEFEKITKGKGKKIGEVVKEKKIEIKDKNIDIEFSLDELRNAWKNAIEKEKG